MKNKLMISLLVFCSCRYHNPDGHNYLKFSKDFNTVYDSLNIMEDDLDNIPQRLDELNTTYEMYDEQIYINDININMLDTNKYRSILKIKEKFIRNAFFLNAINIKSAYFDSSVMGWKFTYRRRDDQGFNDIRNIQIQKKNSHQFKYSNMDTILDQKNNIYLLAPKGAIIR